MPNKYHEALNEAIRAINYEMVHRYHEENKPPLRLLQKYIDRLYRLQTLLNTPQLKQSLKELDLEAK